MTTPRAGEVAVFAPRLVYVVEVPVIRDEVVGAIVSADDHTLWIPLRLLIAARGVPPQKGAPPIRTSGSDA